MNMKNIFIFLSLFFFLFSCSSDKDFLDTAGTQAPKVKYSLDVLTADLNKIDNLPVTGVVTSQLGLASVDMYIIDGEADEYLRTETQFFNKKSYSLAEKITYKDTYKGFVVEARDLAGRITLDTLKFEFITVKDAPKIVFEPEKIEYDETNPTPMPNTKFTVTSTAGIKTIEMSLMTASGATQFGEPLDFTSSPRPEFTFEEAIVYNEDSRGFRVKATDIYDQVTYATMIVEYKSVPPPVLTIEQTYLHSLNANGVSLPMHITSVAGVKSVEIFKTEEGVETSVLLTKYNGENELNITPKFDLTDKTTEIRVLVTDQTLAQRTDSKKIKAIIGLDFIDRAEVGSQVYAAGLDKVASLFSLKDMKTYTVDEILTGVQSEQNVDFKFYLFGGQSIPRIYSIDGGNNTKSNEYKGSKGNVSDFVNPTKTRFLKLSGFDFENATADKIRTTIIPGQVTLNQINPIAPNDVIAFITKNSTSGEDRIGVIKFVKLNLTNTNNKVQGIFTISVKMLP